MIIKFYFVSGKLTYDEILVVAKSEKKNVVTRISIPWPAKLKCPTHCEALVCFRVKN